MKQCHISRWMYFTAMWIIVILIVMIHTTLRESYMETFGNPEYFQGSSSSLEGEGNGSYHRAPAKVYIQSEVDTDKFIEETDKRLKELATRVSKVETQLTDASKGAVEASNPTGATIKPLAGPPGDVAPPQLAH